MARRKLSDIVKADLEKIEQSVLSKGNDIRVVVMNTVKSALVRRIFNDGGATNGGNIGQYARSTKIFRNKIGRRIDKVDLGVTNTLKNSVQLGIYKLNIVLGIVGNNEPKLRLGGNRKGGFKGLKIVGTSNYPTTENAIGQEKNFGKDIFAPTSDEINLGDKTLEKEINLAVKKAL